MRRIYVFYSVRRAITGSFFAAALAGIKPLMSVSATLTHTIINAEVKGKLASVVIPVKCPSNALMPMDNK